MDDFRKYVEGRLEHLRVVVEAINIVRGLTCGNDPISEEMTQAELDHMEKRVTHEVVEGIKTYLVHMEKNCE